MSNNLFLVYPENAESGTIETLPETENLSLINEDQFSLKKDTFSITDKVCITSEASFELVLNNIKDKTKRDAVESLKDKFLFREMLQRIYPDYNYKSIQFEDIANLSLTKKCVLKPVKGCFGTAVKVLDEDSNLSQISHEVKSEIDKNSKILSDKVLSKSDFLLEDFIEGEEYAIDMFYDSKGRPHIANIYYHPIPKNKAYLHMIYYTSKSVFEKVYDRAITFFNTLNNNSQFKNIAFHAEFKLDGKLFPIEINAMRFGGMGLGNMIYHSLEINPYEYFINEESPNWDEIWKNRPDVNFAYFIAYIGTNVDKDKQRPNIEKLESQFGIIHNKTIFDYKTQLALGVYTLEETKQNIDKLLNIEFNDYFEDIIS